MRSTFVHQAVKNSRLQLEKMGEMFQAATQGVHFLEKWLSANLKKYINFSLIKNIQEAHTHVYIHGYFNPS